MKILVCGSRYYKNAAKIKAVLLHHKNDTLIHGNCKGADRIAAEVGRCIGMRVIAYPADWSLGKRAGPIRNQKMLDDNPELVLVFHEDLDSSKGTKDMLSRIKDIPYEHYD